MVEPQVNIGALAIIAIIAAVGAVWRRSPRLVLAAVAAALGEIAFRRWVSRSSSAAARRLRGPLSGPRSAQDDP